jgi:hypothetical protein
MIFFGTRKDSIDEREELQKWKKKNHLNFEMGFNISRNITLKYLDQWSVTPLSWLLS